jgi:hypothetical protein
LFADVTNYIADNYADRILNFKVPTNCTIIPSESQIESLSNFNKNSHVTVILDDYRTTVPINVKRLPVIEKMLNDAGIDNYINPVYKNNWVDFRRENNCVLNNDMLTKFHDICRYKWGIVCDGKYYPCSFIFEGATAGQYEFADTDFIEMATADDMLLFEYHMGYRELGYLSHCYKCNGHFEINKTPIPAAVQIPKLK